MPSRPFMLMSICLLCGVVWTQASCSRPATADVDPREFILRSWGTNLILPQYAALEQDATALATQSEAFCANPNSEGLTQTRAAWRATRVSWKHMEVLGFGPHVEFPERYASTLDFWPARADTIEETLGMPDRIAALDTAGAASRGLPVLDYLLFEPGDQDATLAAFADTPARCDYLIAASRDVSAQAKGVHDAWRPGAGNYFDTMLNPQDHNEGMFADRQEALSEVVNRMAFLIDNIRRDKLGKPAGETSGTPSPQSVESRFSDHGIADIQANLDMVEWLYQGREDLENPDDAYWLKDHPRLSTRDDIHQAFDAQLIKVRAALDALSIRPLAESSTDNREEVFEAIELLGELQRLIQIDVINALSLTRTFNDSDGD